MEDRIVSTNNRLSKTELAQQFHRNIGFFSLKSQRQIRELFEPRLGSFLETDAHSFLYTSDTCSCIYAATGLPSVKVGKRFLHSRYHPGKEASREIESLRLGFHRIKSLSFIAVMGGDLLYGLEKLLATWASDSTLSQLENFFSSLSVHVFSALDELFFITLLHRDLRFLQRLQGNLHFHSQAFQARASHRFLEKEFPQSSLRASSWLFLERAACLKLAPNLLDIKRAMLALFTQEASKLLTRYFFEKRWIKNIITNVYSYPKAYAFSALQGRYRGKSALIIAAGPSLDFLLDELVQLVARQRFVIICVDTALPCLYDKNILPDFIISLDGGYYNSLDFYYNEKPALYRLNSVGKTTAPVKQERPSLIAYAGVYPSIPRDYLGNIFFFDEATEANSKTPAKAAQSLLAALGLSFDSRSSLALGSSVLSASFAASLAMGFSSLTFYGVDFCIPEYRSHAEGSLHSRLYRQKETKLFNKDTADFHMLSSLLGHSASASVNSTSSKSHPYPSTQSLLAHKKEFLQIAKVAKSLGKQLFIRNVFPQLWTKANSPGFKILTKHETYTLLKPEATPKQEKVAKKTSSPQNMLSQSLAIQPLISLTESQKALKNCIQNLLRFESQNNAVLQFLLAAKEANQVAGKQKSQPSPAEINFKALGEKYGQILFLLGLAEQQQSLQESSPSKVVLDERKTWANNKIFLYLQAMLASYKAIVASKDKSLHRIQYSLLISAELGRIIALSLERLTVIARAGDV